MNKFWYTVLGIGLGIAGTVAFGKKKEICARIENAYNVAKEKIQECNCNKTEETPVE